MSATKAITPRAAREAKKLRREELATKAKVSLGTVAICEQNSRWPKQAFVRERYLAALGLSEDDIAAKGSR